MKSDPSSEIVQHVWRIMSMNETIGGLGEKFQGERGEKATYW